MAVDKVRPLKMEHSSLGGTQDDMFPRATNPNQDYLATKGVAFEDSNDHLVDLGAGKIQFTDPTIGTKSVDDVQSTARVSSNDTTPANLKAKLVAGAGIAIVETSDGGNETLVFTASAADPFATALFDDCTPLFDKDTGTGAVVLLEECG